MGIAVSTSTDLAKGIPSVLLTEPGWTNIVALVEQGRAINQRILTWIINKISRTILRAAFVVTGKFVFLPCDAPAGLHDRFRESLPRHRPGSMVQETGDLEHQRPHHHVRSREPLVLGDGT